MRVVGVIPARHSSSRFPGKPLVPLNGRPMIQWVFERARLCRSLSSVLVATDDERIRACVMAFGGEAVLTSPHHESGTDRLAEVAESGNADVYVNIQGDEPLIDPEDIDRAVRCLLADTTAEMATLAAPLYGEAEYHDPSVVKVVRDESGRALYFSRAPIPWSREAAAQGRREPPEGALRHVGLYAYRREFLLRFRSWGQSPLEKAESLEQLRALEKGVRIQVATCHHRSLAVDTPADVAPVEAALRLLHPA